MSLRPVNGSVHARSSRIDPALYDRRSFVARVFMPVRVAIFNFAPKLEHTLLVTELCRINFANSSRVRTQSDP